MKLITPLFVIVFIVCAGDSAKAQGPVKDFVGRPIMLQERPYNELEGSPFLFDMWVNGTVKFTTGESYKNVPLKYNLLTDELYFKNKQGDTLTFVDPVREFILQYDLNSNNAVKHFRNGFGPTGKNTDKSFYEVLVDGTIQLLKKTTATIAESKEYNATLVHREVAKDIRYYLVKSGQINPLKREEKSILTLADDKADRLKAYIKANNLNLKNDDDLAKLIVYYNSI